MDFDTIRYDDDYMYAIDEQAKEMPADFVEVPEVDQVLLKMKDQIDNLETAVQERTA